MGYHQFCFRDHTGITWGTYNHQEILGLTQLQKSDQPLLKQIILFIGLLYIAYELISHRKAQQFISQCKTIRHAESHTSTVLPKYIIIELFSSGQCKLH